MNIEMPKKGRVDGKLLTQEMKNQNLSSDQLSEKIKQLYLGSLREDGTSLLPRTVSATTIDTLRNESNNVRIEVIETVALALAIPLDRLKLKTHFDFAYIGLLPHAPEEQPNDIPYQSFSADNDSLDFLSYMWTELDGSKINAEMVGDASDYRKLRVCFDNRSQRYPPNLSIHPEGRVCRKRMDKQKALTFKARLVEEADAKLPVSLVVRVGDENLQQWTNIDAEGACVTHHPHGSSDISCKCDLSDKKSWRKFISAGYVANRQPSFECLTTLVIEFGCGEKGQRPGQGRGVVDIWGINLE